MPSLAKSSSANSLSSQTSAKSPPRKYDGIPPELLEAYQCICILVEKEMNQRGTPLSYIPTFDAFLWEAYKVGHVGAKEPTKANLAIQHFLHTVMSRLYSGAESMRTYVDFILIVCIGYKYMGEIYGDPTCSWRTVRSLVRWFMKHAFPTYPPLLRSMDQWYCGVLEPALEKKPETVMELLHVLKLHIPELNIPAFGE